MTSNDVRRRVIEVVESNNDNCGNQERVKVISKIQTLHVHHTFWYIFLLPLHDYLVKCDVFARRKQKMADCSFFGPQNLAPEKQNSPTFDKLSELEYYIPVTDSDL